MRTLACTTLVTALAFSSACSDKNSGSNADGALPDLVATSPPDLFGADLSGADLAPPSGDMASANTTTKPENVPAAPTYDDVGIYVAPNGNDATGDGTDTKPYKTISHVLAEVAEAGDTIILRAGEYAEAVRIRIPNITIRSHSGEMAIISQPLTIDDNDPLMPVMFDVDADGGKLQRVEVKGGFYGVFLQTKWDWGDPSDTMGATNITIEDSVIHDTGRDCIKVTPQSDGLIVRRTEIHHSGMGYPNGTDPDDKNAEGIDVVNADNVLVQDCYIHDTATTGVYLKGGSTGGIIERTRVEHAGSLGIVLGFDTSPEFFDLTTNPDYYENIDGIVRNCVVIDTRYAGIALYAAKNPKLINNTIIDTAKQAHAPIYFGITLQDYDADAKRPANVNPVVVNNLVSQPTGGACVAIRFYFEEDELGKLNGLQPGSAITMDNNLYYSASGSCTFDDARESGLEGATLAAWASHIGGEAASLTTNPMLTTDGHLQTGSPAIDKGATRSEVGFDIDKEARSGAFDIGADEK